MEPLAPETCLNKDVREGSTRKALSTATFHSGAKGTIKVMCVVKISYFRKFLFNILPCILQRVFSE